MRPSPRPPTPSPARVVCHHSRRALRSSLALLALALTLSMTGGLLLAQEKPAAGAKAKGAKPAAPAPGDEILGEWWTEDREGRIRFRRHKDGTFRGITTCCNPQKDVNNPNPKMRDRSTVGIPLIWKLKYDGDGEYSGGYVYNPRDGDVYRFDAEVIDRDTLEIRGYMGIPLLGQTQVWKRARATPRRRARGQSK